MVRGLGDVFQAEAGDGAQQEADAGEAEGGGGALDAGGDGVAAGPRREACVIDCHGACRGGLECPQVWYRESVHSYGVVLSA